MDWQINKFSFWIKVTCCIIMAIGVIVPKAIAQTYTLDNTQTGEIILSNADTMQANFNINLSNDLLQLNIDNTIKTFSARQVQQFVFFDPENKRKRFFFSLPYSEKGSYKVPTFFEVLYANQQLSLYCRESLIIDSAPMYDAISGRSITTTRLKLQTEFYLLLPNGRLVRYKGRRSELLDLLKPKDQIVKQFIKDANLVTTERFDLIKIVDYYNSLFNNPKPQK